ncbi:MAG: RNA methyltransferase [Myxococcota bacterium]
MRIDDPDVIEVEGPPPLEFPAEQVIAALSPVVTEARRRRIEAVVDQRTDQVVIVLDAITDPHNASAVMRSADAFGIQRIFVVEGSRGFVASGGVAKGTHRWLDVVRYQSATDCFQHLQAEGYEVHVAAMAGDRDPEALSRVGTKLALVFGNEHRGVSEEMSALADGTFAIPMVGFVESLNVSVAAAITMRSLARQGLEPMSEPKREALKARFLMNSVNNAEEVIRAFLGNDAEP